MAVPKVRKAPRLSRPERKERTRSDLVAAARRVFERHGFHRASLEQIAEEAGYTKGAVYSNFSSKEDLFFAVYERRVDRHEVHVAELFSEPPDAGEAILRVIAAVGDLRRRRADGWMAVFLEFWTHVLRNPEHRARFNEAHKRAVVPFQLALERFAAQQGITLAIPADQVAMAMFAMENGIGLERLTDPEAADADLPVRLVKLIFEGLVREADGKGA
jgi:AcrR family transcriptional regulator